MLPSEGLGYGMLTFAQQSGHVKLLVLFVILVAPCLAQAQKAPSLPASKGLVCGVSKGCGTFNEMLRNNDPVTRRDSRTTTLACFYDQKDMDSFLLVEFGREQQLSWTLERNAPGFNLYTSTDYFGFTDFQDGVANREEFWALTWKRSVSKSKTDQLAPFVFAELAEKTDDTAVSINEVTIGYTTKFENIDKEKVEYTLQIRRSTKRFQERFITPSATITRNGHCIVF